MRISRNIILTSALLPALMGSQCSTISAPASVEGVKAVVRLDTLAGAQGNTVTDQSKIDITMSRGCATGLASKASCAQHTRLSDERRLELEGQRQ